MNNQRLQDLIEKVLSGTSSEIEKKELNEWYRVNRDQEVLWPNNSDVSTDVEARMLKNIQKHIKSQNKIVPFYRRNLGKVAAIFLGATMITSYIFFFGKSDKNHVSAMITRAIAAPLNATENRYLLLPDSSTILLHPGSHVKYTFNENIREVTLIGEAYFDVKHLTDRPFVVHTGKITTTVLGTAFNIQAYPHRQVTVSVARGKVSVTDEVRKTMITLTPNKQVEYTSLTGKAILHQVDTKSIINWVKADLQFSDMPFGVLAEKLSRRYNVLINFKNERLKHCLINGRFTGTESLEEVLNSVAPIVGGNCRISGNEVIIDGIGCDN